MSHENNPYSDSTKQDQGTTNIKTDADLQSLFQILIEHAQNSEPNVVKNSKSSDKVMSRSAADKYIEKQNDKWENVLIKDAESKRKFRRNILAIVFSLLGFQIFFLNIIILKVIDTAFTVNPDTLLPIIPYETIVSIVDMLKWYTTAIVAELLTSLIFIVHSVFETPKKPK